ncbi:MAG TPA: transporter substrate-binding domain-containing protein, partial [Vicinamibacteria bacterium]|nr:transporter substrate-binding domain-containing protein [Vicinamibacteria bacterium]
MRKTHVLAATAVLAATMPLHAADLAAIKQSGTLRMLSVVVEKEPEFVSGQAERPGFDREVLEGFARLHRVKLELVPVATWDGLIPALLKDKGDVIAGRYTATDTRRKQIDFTTEVFPTRPVAVTRKPRMVATLEDLREEKVGIVKGTSLVDVLAAAGVPPAQIDDGLIAGGTFAALKAGRVTCIVEEVAAAILAQREDPDLRLGAFVGPAGSYAYGVRHEDTGLRAAL